MESKPVPGRVPELVVEKLALGEASPEQARLATPEEKARAAALSSDNAAILAQYPAHQFAAQVKMRAAQAAPGSARRFYVPALAMAVGALAIGLFAAHQFDPSAGRPGPGDPIIGEQVRLKGAGPRLLVYRKEGEQAAQLRPGSEAQAGDLIQLGYLANGQRYGVIVSVDARGGATLHFPTAPDAPLELTRGGSILLDHAFQLDDAPAFERFFLLTVDEAHRTALSVAQVLEQARALAADRHAAETKPLALPATLHQESFLLRKKARN